MYGHRRVHGRSCGPATDDASGSANLPADHTIYDNLRLEGAAALRFGKRSFTLASRTDLHMRKWHRWLSLFFGMFMLWIATTGVLSQAAELLPGESAAAAPASAAPPGFQCPEGWRCMPPRPEGGAIFWIDGIHA